jgi:SAM-dependent methyltransferase
VYPCSSGIWRFLPEERLAQYEQFLREYQIVRDDQGWGRPDADYFLALPHVGPDDPQQDIWRRRSESYRLLTALVIEPMAARLGRPVRILDLGAGSCWLAYRLAELGHQVAAVDLSVDTTDGLGAHVWYRPARARTPREYPLFTPIQAEFDRLPLPGCAADVAVFNGSLHYSTEYTVTLREALRVLSPQGALVVVDSPIYRQAASGEQMVREREQTFQRAYGFRSSILPAERFLTRDRLAELARDLELRWQVYAPAGRLGSWHLSAGAPLLSTVKREWRRLRGLRDLAEMPVIVGDRPGD